MRPLLTFVFFLLAAGHVYAREALEIPVRFHVVVGLDMEKRGVQMDAGIGEREVGVLLEEANRIWEPAGIEWVSDGVVHAQVPAGEARNRALRTLRKTKRDEAGKADPKRIRKIYDAIDLGGESPNAVNVYFVPYLGEASQGNAKPKKARVLIGLWSDKESKGARPPNRMPLVESGAYRHGSVGRTLAHELGHVLGLKHPDKRAQIEFGLLMGGKRKGYRLTPGEIATARAAAAQMFRMKPQSGRYISH